MYVLNCIVPLTFNNTCEALSVITHQLGVLSKKWPKTLKGGWDPSVHYESLTHSSHDNGI